MKDGKENYKAVPGHPAWSYKVSVSFVELPEEKEAAYWAAISYFAEVMFSDLISQNDDFLSGIASNS